jgi:hypothetical protein
MKFEFTIFPTLNCKCQRRHMMFSLNLVIKCLGLDLQSKHIAIRLFEATKTYGQTLALIWQKYWTSMFKAKKLYMWKMNDQI